MAKDRVNTNFGPALITLTGTTGTTVVTTWNHLGPVQANKTNARISLSSSPSSVNNIKIEAIWYGGRSSGLTTASSAVTGAVNIISINSNASPLQATSTSALLFNWWRARSTDLDSGVTATIHYGGLNG